MKSFHQFLAEIYGKGSLPGIKKHYEDEEKSSMGRKDSEDAFVWRVQKRRAMALIQATKHKGAKKRAYMTKQRSLKDPIGY